MTYKFSNIDQQESGETMEALNLPADVLPKDAESFFNFIDEILNNSKSVDGWQRGPWRRVADNIIEDYNKVYEDSPFTLRQVYELYKGTNMTETSKHAVMVFAKFLSEALKEKIEVYRQEEGQGYEVFIGDKENQESADYQAVEKAGRAFWGKVLTQIDNQSQMEAENVKRTQEICDLSAKMQRITPKLNDKQTDPFKEVLNELENFTASDWQMLFGVLQQELFPGTKLGENGEYKFYPYQLTIAFGHFSTKENPTVRKKAIQMIKDLADPQVSRKEVALSTQATRKMIENMKEFKRRPYDAIERLRNQLLTTDGLIEAYTKICTQPAHIEKFWELFRETFYIQNQPVPKEVSIIGRRKTALESAKLAKDGEPVMSRSEADEIRIFVHRQLKTLAQNEAETAPKATPQTSSKGPRLTLVNVAEMVKDTTQNSSVTARNAANLTATDQRVLADEIISSLTSAGRNLSMRDFQKIAGITINPRTVRPDLTKLLDGETIEANRNTWEALVSVYRKKHKN